MADVLMTNNQAERHRTRIKSVIAEHTFEHQREAASRTFSKFESGAKAVVIAAEMQSGKSGIALALSCLQRNSLSDEQICNRRLLKDTLYLVTMADVALLEQAKADFALCPNMVVSNFTNFRHAIISEFKYQAPKLIIIDECHYGSHQDGVRYGKIFEYLDQENSNCNLAFISATPFSALFAAGSDSILRHHYQTQLVFHKTNTEYLGIRSMHKNHQIVKLDITQRDFCQESLLRRRFIRQFNEHQGPGWSLVRVPSGLAASAKAMLIEQGISQDQIFIIGQRLSGVEEHEISSIQDFKIAYDAARLFDEKLIAITVAGFRAGINFGQQMKEELINSWDSTISNIAAVVQANIGRACGYHHNTTALHYTNLDAISAYSDIIDALEKQTENCDFNKLHQVFESICSRYQVTAFDRGLSISPRSEPGVSTKLDDSKTYLTAGYLIVPAKLDQPNFDFTIYTQEKQYLDAIQLIREELLKDGGPFIKRGRALRGDKQNWIKAQWVNGATYNDYTEGCTKNRILKFIKMLNDGERLEFNTVVNPGGGEITEDKLVMASIFSIYNLSGQVDAYKRTMDDDDMREVCELLDCQRDDTVIVLFKRGEFSSELTQSKQEMANDSRLKEHSIFKL